MWEVVDAWEVAATWAAGTWAAEGREEVAAALPAVAGPSAAT
jgi:hypothetical protein